MVLYSVFHAHVDRLCTISGAFFVSQKNRASKNKSTFKSEDEGQINIDY